MKRKPYPKYKPSGVEWLGDVPEHWTTLALRRMSSRYAGGTPDRSNDSYWDGGSIPWINSGAVNQGLVKEPSEFITEDAYRNSSARWVPKGALVMALAGQGKTKGMVAQTGIATTCNQSMAAICPAPPTEARYLYWLLVSQYEHIRNMAGGEARDGLNLEILGSIPCLKIPGAEQRAIAAFLDRETGRIDSLIAKKRELVERLKEKRTALISHTVTHGLPPEVAKKAGLPVNPSLKPSGVEWLGDIPEHWEATRLKWFFKHVYRYPTYYDIQYVDDGVPEIRGEALADGEIVELDDQRFISQETNARFPQTILDIGDIVMSVRGTMGKIGVVRSNFKGANITANLLRLSPDERQAIPSFLSWLFRSSFFSQALDRVCPQTTIQTVTMPQLSAIALSCPPLPEQAVISAYLDAETTKLDALVAKIEEAVERLQEYRTALITAAVTGKVDVRHYVPQSNL